MSSGSNINSVMSMVRCFRGTFRIFVAPHSNPSTIVSVLYVLNFMREIQETVSGRYENFKVLIYVYSYLIRRIKKDHGCEKVQTENIRIGLCGDVNVGT